MSYSDDELDGILRRSGYRCHICNGGGLSLSNYPSDWHVDHRNPLALGGADRPGNWYAAHVDCNSRKSAKPMRAVREDQGLCGAYDSETHTACVRKGKTKYGGRCVHHER